MSEQPSIFVQIEQPQVEYRDIVGFPGYRVGNDGSVWSCLRGRWKRMKPKVKPETGHLKLGLIIGNSKKQKQMRVHRLVLEAFVGPCPDGMECCHFPDRDPANNHLFNLRWDTKKANAADRNKHGYHPSGPRGVKGEKNCMAKLTGEIVRAMRLERLVKRTFIRELAERHGVDRSTAYNAIKGATWAHIK